MLQTAQKEKETLILRIPFPSNIDLDSFGGFFFKLEFKQCFIFQNSHTHDQVEEKLLILEICDRFEINSWEGRL